MTAVLTAGLRHLGAVGLGRTAAALVVLQVTVLAIVGWFAPHFGPREPFAGSWEDLVGTQGDLIGTIVSRLQRWDGLWYQHIAQAGYSPTDGSAAFQPLYPLLGWLVARPLAGNVALGLILVSCVSYGVALWLVGRLARLEAPALLRGPGGVASDTDERSTRIAILAMVSIAAFPTAYFFVAPFTESLFLMLAVAAFWLARTGRLWPAAMAAILAALVRTQGVFLALPIAWEALRAAGLLGRRPGSIERRHLVRAGVGFLAAAAPVAALLAWFAWQTAVLGAAAVGVGAQAPWGYQPAIPWEAVASSVAYIGDSLPRPMGFIEALNLACLIGFAGLAVAARRLPFSHTLYTVPSLLLYGTRVMWFIPLMSVSRYVVVLFPCFIGLAAILERRPRVAIAWLVVSIAAQLVLFQWWVRWGFVA